MKRTTITTFFIAIVCSLFISASAQEKEPTSPEERAGKLTEWMKTTLQLTNEQETKVQDINLRYAQKNNELKTSTAPKMKKAKIAKANDKAKDEELKAVLTPEQFKTYQAKKEELKKKMKEKRQAG